MEQRELKDVPDFSGKVLIVYIANAPRACQDGIVVEHGEIAVRAGRLFLVGRVPNMKGQEWLSNCETAIAWDSIVQYIEFKSQNDFQEHMKNIKPSVMQKLGM